MIVIDWNLAISLEKSYGVGKCKKIEFREFDNSSTLNINYQLSYQLTNTIIYFY